MITLCEWCGADAEGEMICAECLPLFKCSRCELPLFPGEDPAQPCIDCQALMEDDEAAHRRAHSAEVLG